MINRLIGSFRLKTGLYTAERMYYSGFYARTLNFEITPIPINHGVFSWGDFAGLCGVEGGLIEGQGAFQDALYASDEVYFVSYQA